MVWVQGYGLLLECSGLAGSGLRGGGFRLQGSVSLGLPGPQKYAG